MKFTLDMNAIIDIDEKREPYCTALNNLISLAGKHEIEVFYCVASAAERQKNGNIGKDYRYYKERLKRLGLDQLKEIILPSGTIGESFYVGKTKLPDKETGDFQEKTRNVLFGSITWENLKWNQRRDVETFISHVDKRSDVLITRDSHFLRKISELKKIAKAYNGSDIDILTPEDALRKAEEFTHNNTPNATQPKK